MTGVECHKILDQNL